MENQNYTFNVDVKTQKLVTMVRATNNQAVIDKCYGQLIDDFVRQQYSQSQVEAILNNYLDDMTNQKAIAEFTELQNYRKVCKAYAKQLLGI